MKTRSQTKHPNVNEKQQLYEVNIDFDAASEAWRTNKKSVGNGFYKYICPVEKMASNVVGRVISSLSIVGSIEIRTVNIILRHIILTLYNFL